MNEIYLAVVNKDPDSGKYEIRFPDVENAVTFAETEEKIYEMAEDVLAACLSFTEPKDFPPASTITSIAKNLKENEFVRAIILNYNTMAEYRQPLSEVGEIKYSNEEIINEPDSITQTILDNGNHNKSHTSVVGPLMTNDRRRSHYDKLFNLVRTPHQLKFAGEIKYSFDGKTISDHLAEMINTSGLPFKRYWAIIYQTPLTESGTQQFELFFPDLKPIEPNLFVAKNITTLIEEAPDNLLKTLYSTHYMNINRCAHCAGLSIKMTQPWPIVTELQEIKIPFSMAGKTQGVISVTIEPAMVREYLSSLFNN